MADPRPRRKRGGPWGLIAVVVVVVLVAGFLVYSAIGKKSSAARYVTSQVTRGTLTVAVAGNGSVVSEHSAAVDPAVSGTVSQLNASLGAKVKKGDVLFVIENPDLDASVAQARAQLRNAQSSLAKSAQARTQARQQKTSTVLQAKSQYLQAQSATTKAKQAYIAAKKPPSDALSVKAAKASWQAAIVSQKGAKLSYHQAEDNAEQNYSAAVSAYNASSSSKHSAQLGYDNAVTNADKRTVRAPISGYVTTLSVQDGDQLGTSRTSSASTSSSTGGTTPIVISDLSSLQAQVQISETDRPKVKRGQKVELTFDAVPDLTLTGKVSEIDAVGTSSQSVVTYGVTISLDVQNKKLNPGMTTSASIVTKVDTDVLLVPNAAIKTDSGGGSYVQVLASAGATPTDVTVTTGPAGDTQTEIKSGLKGGENVVTQTITAGSTSTSSSRSGLGVLGGGAARGAGGGVGFRQGP